MTRKLSMIHNWWLTSMMTDTCCSNIINWKCNWRWFNWSCIKWWNQARFSSSKWCSRHPKINNCSNTVFLQQNCDIATKMIKNLPIVAYVNFIDIYKKWLSNVDRKLFCGSWCQSEASNMCWHMNLYKYKLCLKKNQNKLHGTITTKLRYMISISVQCNLFFSHFSHKSIVVALSVPHCYC